MIIVSQLRALSKPQGAAFTASLLGWALDAFDFFLLTFVMKDIAADFHTKVSAVSQAIVLTLAARPIGAFIFGRLADHFGRRPILMIDVTLYAALALASAFSPDLQTLLILRFLFGIAMGGEWGIGASLTLESIPAKSRGVVSGILQQGYPMGFFLASLAFFAVDRFQAFTGITAGWRVMLGLGVLPALLILYIRRHVPESPAWLAAKAGGAKVRRPGFFTAMKGHWRLMLYVVLLMTCFNFFSHGTQDHYPDFLRIQHKFPPATVTALTMVLNLGAIVGGFFFGWVSEWFGRRRTIVLCALFALPVIPLWAYSTTPVMLGVGAFLIQIAVQGAWGVVPAHLNELSPPDARGTFPGFAYQLGNLFAAGNAYLQAWIAEKNGDDYSLALASVCAVVAVLVALFAGFGPEAKGRALAPPETEAA
jgi:SHS family lactate transporter-like MFS transporter